MVGTCEIVMLNRDSSVPRRTIARQTARCACRRGQIAGTTRARPACVDGEFNGLSCPVESNRSMENRCYRLTDAIAVETTDQVFKEISVKKKFYSLLFHKVRSSSI